MLERTLEKLRFPIGQFHKPDVFTTDLINGYIRTIEVFPLLVRESVEHLSDVQLDTPYRLGGWTIRQVVHHCADSHLNSFIRFKLALTEESPTINPYDEGRWAELPDTLDLPVTHSLTLLDGLHARWAYLLKSLDGNNCSEHSYTPQAVKHTRWLKSLRSMIGIAVITWDISNRWHLMAENLLVPKTYLGV